MLNRPAWVARVPKAPSPSSAFPGALVILNFNWRQHINASMIRNKYLVSKTIDFFFDVYDSRFEVGYHRIIDGRMRQRLIDFFLEELSSLFEDRYVGSQHEALRLAKVI
jgi:hypothetical protein